MPAYASRLHNALAHLATLDYTPHDFLKDLLRSNDASFSRVRDELRENTFSIIFALVPAARTKLHAVLTFLGLLDYDIPALLADFLACNSPDVAADAERTLPDLLFALSSARQDAIASWALDLAEPVYVSEIRKASHVSAGSHAGARSAKPAQVENFNLSDTAAKLRGIAPHTWRLFSSLIDAKGSLKRALESNGPVQPAAVWLVGPGDIGAHDDVLRLDDDNDEGSDSDSDDEDGAQAPEAPAEDDMSVDQQPPARSRRTPKSLRRHSALAEIKVVTMFGIVQQATNQKSNAIQLSMGTFLRMTHVPDVVVNVLNHIGITVSNKSMDNVVKSLSKAESSSLVRRGSSRTSQKAFDNYNFNEAVAMATLARWTVYRSMISALDIASHPSLTPEHFKFVDVTWETNSAITVPREWGQRRPYEPTFDEILALASVLYPHAEPADMDAPSYRDSSNAWYMRQTLVQQSPGFDYFSDRLGQPDRVQVVEPHKTDWAPLRAMDLNQSQTADTIEALEEIFRQTGITDEIADDYVTFVHGDLGGSERILSAQLFRSREETSTAQLRSVVDVPGLFHVLMASEDAVFRLHVLPKEARFDTPKGISNIFKYVEQLLPKDSARFKTKSPGPTFRRAHDTFTHIMWALILESWTLAAAEWNPECTSLELFCAALRKRPRDEAWGIIMKMSLEIAEKYVAGPSFHEEREAPAEDRDMNFENNRLFLSHMLLHTDLNYSIKIQDVGRVVQALCTLILTWAATKKHKYCAHIQRVLVNLAYVFPPLLKEAFLTSWTINPSGKPEGGRGVDWLVELYNMYIKVIHCGASSNFGIEEMIKVSPLIKLYKSVFDSFVVNYYILGRTVKHAKPDMRETIEHLRRTMHEDEALIFKRGRSVAYEVPDAMSVGLHMYLTGKAGDLAADVSHSEGLEIDDFDME